VGGVTITIDSAEARYGGCGDMGVWPLPEGGAPPCGDVDHVSFTTVIRNNSTHDTKVTVSGVRVLVANDRSELCQAGITGATAAGSPFAGVVAPGGQVDVTYELGRLAGETVAEVLYEVTFLVDGVSVMVSSPPFQIQIPM